MPEDFCKSVFIPIPKVARTTECKQFRTISLISHAAKVLLTVIHNRIKPTVEEHLSEDQYGFRRGRGTRECIFSLRILCERALEMQQNMYVCFVDFEKAFDRVRHNKLVQILLNIGIDINDIRIIKTLYWTQEAAVRIGNGLSNWCKVRRGVRQGCVLSPLLYNLYSEMLMREVIRDEDGININGTGVSNIRYADDTAFIARSPEELQGFLDRLQTRGAKYGLHINVGKTRVMAISRDKTKPVIGITVAGQDL